jgi:hypothetical protein
MRESPPPLPRGPVIPRKIVVMVLAVIGALILFPQVMRLFPTAHFVEYSVQGEVGTKVSVTYRTGGRDPERHATASTSWSMLESIQSGGSYYVSARTLSGGDITCTVTIDGTRVDSHTSSGPEATCTSRGTV